MKTFRMFNFELFSFHWDNDGEFTLSVCEWETAHHEGSVFLILTHKGRVNYVDFLSLRKLWEQWRDK